MDGPNLPPVISTWTQLPPARPFTPVQGLPDPKSGSQLAVGGGGV